MTASHDYRMADLEAENAKLRASLIEVNQECDKLRADLAEARKSLDALRAAPSDIDISHWWVRATAIPFEPPLNGSPTKYVMLAEEVTNAVALMRRASAAPAPSALVVEAKNILAIIDAARARMDHAGIDLAHGNHVILDHEGAINRLRAALAAEPSAQPVAVPEAMRAHATYAAQVFGNYVGGSGLAAKRCAEWILSLAAPQPATPAAQQPAAPDAELARLILDRVRLGIEDIAKLLGAK